MSNTIDTRVVQMEFDNSSFEKGVRTSLYSLEELKRGLDLDKATASISNLEKTFAGFSLGHIESAIDDIGDKLSALGVLGVTAMQRISDAAIDAGAKIAKALTIDNVGFGFNKYEQLTNAVQAIHSALPNTALEEVYGVMETLNKYTDETSYSFTDMANTIGKFVNAGVGLASAEKAIEGIANAAADAGVGIQQAYPAFYNISQAMAKGKLKYDDYASLEHMNFATIKFRQTLMDTGVEMGTLTKKGSQYFTIAKKGSKAVEVTTANLGTTLQQDWATAAVLEKTLLKYQDRTTEFGEAAFKAAQEAKTFTDAVGAIKDAVSTSWMNSFRYMFGDLKDASELWTDFANKMIEFTDRGAELRNGILGAAADHGVRQDLVDSFYNLFEPINILGEMGDKAIRKALGFYMLDTYKANHKPEWYKDENGIWREKEVTGYDIIADKIKEVTEKIKASTEGIRGFFEENRYDFLNIFDGVIGVIGFVKQAFSGLGTVIKGVLTRIKPVFTPIVKLLGSIGKFIGKLSKNFERLGIFKKWGQNILNGLQPIFNLVTPIIEKIEELRKIFDETSGDLSTRTGIEKGNGLFNGKVENNLTKVINGLVSLGNIASQVFGFLGNVFSQIVAAIAPYASDFISWVGDMAGTLGEWITKVEESGVITDTLEMWSDKLGGVIKTLEGWADTAWEWISSTGIIEAIKRKFNSFNRWLTTQLYGTAGAQKLAADQLKEINKQANKGNVNLEIRPIVTLDEMRKRGWDVGDGEGIATLFSSSYTEQFGERTITFGITPIMPNGEVLTPSGLENYVQKLIDIGDWDKALAFDRSEEGRNLILPWIETPDGGNVDKDIAWLDNYLNDIHELHEILFGVGKESDDATETMSQFADQTNKQASGIEIVQNALNNLHTKLTQLATWFNEHSISDMLNTFFGGLSSGFNAFFGKIGNFLTADTSNEKGLVNKLNARVQAMKDTAEDGSEIPSALNTVLTWIQKINTFVGSVGGDFYNNTIKGGKILRSVGEAIGNFIGGFLLGAVGEEEWNLKSLAKAGKFVQFFNQLIQSLVYAADTFGIGSSLSQMIEDINTSLTGSDGYYTVRLQRIANSILAVGLGVAAIAWAIGKLSSIDALADAKFEDGKWNFDGSGLAGGLAAFSIILTELGAFMTIVGDNKELASGKGGIFGFGQYSSAISMAIKLGGLALAISSIANSIKVLSEIQFLDIPKVDSDGISGSLISGLTAFTTIIGELILFMKTTAGLELFGGGIVGAFTAGGKLKALGETVKNLAEAVKILAEIPPMSAMILDAEGKVDWAATLKGGNLISGLTGLFFLLEELAIFMKQTGSMELFGTTKWGTFKLEAISKAVHSLAESVKILADIPPMNAMITDAEGNIDWASTLKSGNLLSGLTGLFFVLEELALFIHQNGKGTELLGATQWGTFKLGAIANAAHSLAETVQMLAGIPAFKGDIVRDAEGNLDWARTLKEGGLVTGLSGLFVLLEELALFIGQTGKGTELLGDTKWGTFKLEAISRAVHSLAETVNILSEIKPLNADVFDENGKLNWAAGLEGGGLISGMSALFILLEGLVGITRQFNGLDAASPKSIPEVIATLGRRLDLMEIASAVSMLTDSLVKLSSLNPEQLATGLIGVAGESGILFVLEKFLLGLKDLTIQDSIANLIDSGKFMVIAQSMNLLSDGIIKLSKIPFDDLGKGLGTMIVSMVAAGGGAEWFKNISLADIGSMLVDVGAFVGGAIGLFTGLQQLIDWLEILVNEQLVKDPDKVWSVEGQLTKFAEVMTALGNIFGSLFGGIVGGFIGSMKSAEQEHELSTNDVIKALTDMGELADAINYNALEQLEGQIQKLKELGGSLIFDMGGYNRVDAATPIYELAWQLTDLKEALEGLDQVLDNVVDDDYLSKFQNIVETMQGLVGIGSKIYTDTGGENEQIDEWIKGVNRFFTDMTYGSAVGNTAGTLANEFVVAFTGGISSHQSEAYNAGLNIADNAKYGVRSKWGEFYAAGQYIVQGLIEGINSMASELSATMNSLATMSTISPFSSSVELGSPSRLFERFGGFIVEGLVNGINGKANSVEDASNALAYSTINAFDSMGDLSAILNSDMNSVPTIRPILDLSNVQTGADAINSLLDKTPMSARDIDLSRAFEFPSVMVEGSDSMLAAITGINDRLGGLEAAITSMQIVLDTGAVVGSMADGIDQELGARTIMRGRGA